ncbi:MAG: glycosyltransferase family 9 protein [Prevotella sp.]|nr:glycosyltransferase family 9 protein [Prevotella sp.]
MMRGITHYIYLLCANRKGTLAPEEVKHILVCRPNSRLGNQLLITPLIQELSDTFPNAGIDLFVRGNLASILFERYDCVNRIIKLPPKPFKELGKYIGVWLSLRKEKYDISFDVASASSSGRLSACFARARFKFPSNPTEAAELSETHHAKQPVYTLRKVLLPLGIPDKGKPVPEMDIKLSPSELSDGKKVLDGIAPRPEKETICIYTYATGGKCYPKAWWEEVYGRLTANYEEKYNIIEILPKENVSQIDFRAPTWYSLDIREMAAVIANAKAFISADCGVMHLASAAHTPTVGLFSRANIESYRPYNKGSIAIDTRKAGFDEIMDMLGSVLA